MSRDFTKIKCEFDKDDEGTLTCSVSVADGEKEQIQIGKIEDEHHEKLIKELITSGVLMVQTALLKRVLAELKSNSPRNILGVLARIITPAILVLGINSLYIFGYSFWTLLAVYLSSFILALFTSAGLKQLKTML